MNGEENWEIMRTFWFILITCSFGKLGDVDEFYHKTLLWKAKKEKKYIKFAEVIEPRDNMIYKDQEGNRRRIKPAFITISPLAEVWERTFFDLNKKLCTNDDRIEHQAIIFGLEEWWLKRWKVQFISGSMSLSSYWRRR